MPIKLRVIDERVTVEVHVTDLQPKSRSCKMAERSNGRNSPQILKDGKQNCETKPL